VDWAAIRPIETGVLSTVWLPSTPLLELLSIEEAV
jgi:hypothetical protein